MAFSQSSSALLFFLNPRLLKKFFSAVAILILHQCLATASQCCLCALSLRGSKALVSPGRELLPLSSAWIFAAANQKTPTDHLALKACGACVPGSIRTITIKETVLDRLPPKGLLDDWLKHTSSLSVKEDYLFVLELQPEGQDSGSAHTLGPFLREYKLMDAIFVLSLCHTGFSQKSAYLHIWNPNFFQLPPKGHLQIALLIRAYAGGRTRLYDVCIL